MDAVLQLALVPGNSVAIAARRLGADPDAASVKAEVQELATRIAKDKKESPVPVDSSKPQRVYGVAVDPGSLYIEVDAVRDTSINLEGSENLLLPEETVIRNHSAVFHQQLYLENEGFNLDAKELALLSRDDQATKGVQYCGVCQTFANEPDEDRWKVHHMGVFKSHARSRTLAEALRLP